MTENAGKDEAVDRILEYWFGPLPSEDFFPTEKAETWFMGGEKVDQYIIKNFSTDLELARNNELDHWNVTARGTLALIVLLDQFSRNIYRDTPNAFAQDAKARDLTQLCLDKGYDKELHPAERIFIYMPFEHAEDLETQKKCMDLFTKLADESNPAIEFPIRNALDYAEQHFKIIERFKRFPHRNHILGRESTPEELEFLQQPNSSF